MTVFQSGQIERILQDMIQPGEFEGFMVRFLPLYAPSYTGIARHGHTEFAKPKKGTPDLLLTLDNGDQIGCQCGTEKKYWQHPKDHQKYLTWKPIKDINKCLSELNCPVEIILASNQPIPGSHPNAKSIILDYFSNKTKCSIKFFTSSDIAIWLESNLKRTEIFELCKEFFPEAIENIELKQKNIFQESIIKCLDALGFPTTNIIKFLKRSSNEIVDGTVNTEQVITAIYSENNRFTLELPCTFVGIKRCEKQLPKLYHPLGQIIQILGVPKIGKSSLCWEVIDTHHYEYKWFSVPVDDRKHSDFIDVFLISLYSRFLPSNEVVAYTKGFQQKPLDWSKAQIKGNFIFVIDETHHLSDSSLKILNDALLTLKSQNLLHSMAIIFLTNKNLKSKIQVFDEILVAPMWKDTELALLVEQKGINILDESRSKYFKFLTQQSRGHPLLALALSKKYPDRASLAAASFTLKRSDPEDYELSNKIKDILYQDILTTPDEENFVQRLSLLTEPADVDVLDSIRVDVLPNINTGIHTLYEHIGPAVLEGNINSGLKVNATFRDIASNKITPSETKAVYYAAANASLKIENQTVHLRKFMSGIFYLILCGDVMRATREALFIISALSKNDETEKMYLPHVYQELFFFKYVLPVVDREEYFNLCYLRLCIALYYLRQVNFKEAAAYIENIKPDKLDNERIKAKDLKKIKSFAYFIRICLLSVSQNPNNVIEEFIEYFSNHANDLHLIQANNILPTVIKMLPDERLLLLDFNQLAKKLYPEFLSNLAEIAIHIGLKSVKNQLLFQKIEQIDSESYISTKLFKYIFESSLFFHSNQTNKSIILALNAKNLIETEQKAKYELGRAFSQFIADIYFSLGDMNNAVLFYKKSYQDTNQDDKLNIGWNLYKIGLASSDDIEIETNLSKATEYYIEIGNFNQASRAYGALGTHFLMKKLYVRAIEIAIILADWYYQEKRLETGPSLRILLAHIVKATDKIRSKIGQNSEKDLQEIDVKHYSRVLDSARPEAGGITVLQTIAFLAEVTNFEELEKKILVKVAYYDVIGEIDKKIIALCWYKLFQLSSAHEIHESEIILLVNKLIQSQPIPSSEYESQFFLAIFEPIANKAKSNPETWTQILIKVTDILSNRINTIETSLQLRWKPYLLYAEGLSHFLQNHEQAAYKLLSCAVNSAIYEKQWKVGEDAAFLTTFNLYKQHSSIKEFGQANYDLFLCIEGLVPTTEKLKNLGINMFRFWSTWDWRRITESDLRILKYLYNTAKLLKKLAYSESESAPILVALLLKCFNHVNQYHVIPFLKEPPGEIKALLNT